MTWSSPSPHLRLAVTRGPAGPVLHVAGELDAASAAPLDDALVSLQAPGRRLGLDLGRVTFCSLAGAELLVDAYRRAAAAGTALSVQRAHSAVLRTLSVCHHATGLGALPVTGTPGRERPQALALLREALGHALRLTGAPMGNAQLLDPEAGTLRIVAQHGFHRPFLSYFETVEDRESACGVAALDRTALYVEDVRSSAVFQTGAPALDVLTEAGVGAVCSLPVAAPGGPLVGVVSVHHARPDAWDGELRRTLESLARATGSTWQSSVRRAQRRLVRPVPKAAAPEGR
ncbi:STAS domain-containing protein [Streptomyces sp. NPDC001941]|uniref:STAS domain-containing protein n=1 Tax=Streptomyces sp. NPDC001941 TaxID=3154659 RepID=UPI003323B5A3